MREITENTTIESVGEDERIEVVGASLTISGNIGSGAEIELIEKVKNGSSLVGAKPKLIVHGDVCSGADITGDGDMEFRGHLFGDVETYNGNITAGDIGESVSLMTQNGKQS